MKTLTTATPTPQIIFDPIAGGYVEYGNNYFLFPSHWSWIEVMNFACWALSNSISITSTEIMEKALFAYELKTILDNNGIAYNNTKLQETRLRLFIKAVRRVFSFLTQRK
jgi:hypothetical protein